MLIVNDMLTVTNASPDQIQVRYLDFFTIIQGNCPLLFLLLTVMSPNIVQLLILRTSPSDYAICNQIKSFLIFNIGLLLEREKQ